MWMKGHSIFLQVGSWLALIPGLLLSASGCSTDGFIGGTVGVITGATLLGARSPTHEIEQIYYLGVFDPREQVPETIYRVTVRGQASFISFTKFASGWVPASVIDSLGGKVQLSAQAGADLTITRPDPQAASDLQTGRRLVLFGPEGFREAPRNHRLVIVMGTSPEGFFKAIDTALGEFAQVQLEKDNAGLQRELFQALLALKTDQQALKDLELEMAREFK
jgi:hypothetical protein